MDQYIYDNSEFTVEITTNNESQSNTMKICPKKFPFTLHEFALAIGNSICYINISLRSANLFPLIQINDSYPLNVFLKMPDNTHNFEISKYESTHHILVALADQLEIN